MAFACESCRTHHVWIIWSLVPMIAIATWGLLLLSHGTDAEKFECRQLGGILGYLQRTKSWNCFRASRNLKTACPTNAKKCCQRQDCSHDSLCVCHKCGYHFCQVTAGRCHQPLPWPSRGRFVAHNSTAVQLVCDNRFAPSQSPEVVCQGTEWRSPFPSCKRIRYCKKPRLTKKARHIHFDDRLKRRYVPGQSVRVSCDNGYFIKLKNDRNLQRRHTELKITCQTNRKWLARPRKLICVPKCCRIPRLLNGTVKLLQRGSFCFNETIRFSCEECFRLVGPPLTTCTDTTKSVAVPTCEPKLKLCPKLELSDGAEWRHGFSRMCGSKVTAQCPNQKTVIEKSSRCASNGEWLTDNGNGEWITGNATSWHLACKPTTVRKLVVSRRHNDTVELRWRPPKYMRRFVSIYQVTVMSHNYRRAFNFSLSSKLRLKGYKVFNATIKNLKEGTAYTIKVDSFTNKGVQGQDGMTLKLQTTTRPPSPVRNLTCVGSKADNLRAEWQPPDTTAQPLLYLLRYTTKQRINMLKYQQEGESAKISDTQFTLNGLQPFTDYDIVVVPIIADIEGPPAETTCALQPSNYELRSLQQPRLINRNETTAVIEFKTHQDYAIRSYEVYVTEIKNGTSVKNRDMLYIPASFVSQPGELFNFTLGDPKTFKENIELEHEMEYAISWRYSVNQFIWSPFSSPDLMVPVYSRR